MSNKIRKKGVEGKDLCPGSGKSGQGAVVDELEYERTDEKIEVEIRDIIRVKPCDFEALKASFEEWASKWD